MEWLNDLNKILPEFFCRKDVGKLTGGVVSPKYMANLDSLGLGPKRRFVALGRVCYHKSEFIDWFASRVEHIE